LSQRNNINFIKGELKK